MTPKSLLSSIDAGKLALDSLPGFIVTISLLFLIDSLTPANLTENLLTDAQASTMTVVGLIIVVGSTILGLMVDSIFHTFGRWFAKHFWRPLNYEFTYRRYLMEDVGLTLREFEWVQSKGTGLSDTVEKNYLRFTEVAGSSAYAMFLLSIATALFLTKEYAMSNTVALWVAGIIITGSVVLLYTSAISLSKYENRKTAATLNEIRKLTSHLCASKKEKSDVRNKSPWRPVLLWPLLVGSIMFLVSCGLLTEVINPVEGKDMIAISTPVDGNVPTLELTVKVNKDAPATPGDKATSKLVTLNSKVRNPLNLKLVNSDIVQTAGENLPVIPEWKVRVAIGNSTEVQEGDDIYINAFLSFKSESGTRLEIGDLSEGDWLLPVIVTDDSERNYLLAYVKVTISWE